MEVTDVLHTRRQQPGGLQGMLTISIAVHAAFFAAIVFAPTGFLHRSPPPTVMNISLMSGGGGPDVGGMNAISGRPVQQQTPPDEPKVREAIRPPAAAKPEMTVPVPNAKPAKAASAQVKSAPDEARGRTPTKGKEPVFGNAVADTGVRGQGFGLTTSGGVGSGSSLEITGDFCCPEYLTTMAARIRSAWVQNQGARGQTIIRFTIQRDGTITNSEIFIESGTQSLDLAALRAVRATRSLPPLPDAFTNPTLTLRLSFIYQ
jgi:periplasmic protein TonB